VLTTLSKLRLLVKGFDYFDRMDGLQEIIYAVVHMVIHVIVTPVICKLSLRIRDVVSKPSLGFMSRDGNLGEINMLRRIRHIPSCPIFQLEAIVTSLSGLQFCL